MMMIKTGEGCIAISTCSSLALQAAVEPVSRDMLLQQQLYPAQIGDAAAAN
jgi:hypothetical protein